MSFILNTSNIVAGAAMPLKKGIVDYLYYDELQNARNIIDGITNEQNLGSSNPFCLQGMIATISGSTYNITAGCALYQAKMYSSNPTTITLTSGQVVIGTLVTINPFVGTTQDPVTFSNGIAYDVLDYTYIEWSAGTSGSGDFNFANVSYLHDQWHAVGATSEPAYQGAWASNGSSTVNGLRFKVDRISNRVYLSGSATINSNTASIVFYLPTSYRPKKNMYLNGGTCTSSTGAGRENTSLYIAHSDGQVKVFFGSATGTSIDVDFDNVSFPLD